MPSFRDSHRALMKIAWLAAATMLAIAVLGLNPAHAGDSSAPAAGSQSASELKPGALITASNADALGRALPGAAKFAIAHGFRIRIGPQRRIDWSEGFKHATEQYSSQVALTKDDTIARYVAGMPFPLIDVTDPKAAIKIAYNWHMGPFMPDDFALTPWSSNGYDADPSNPSRIKPNEDSNFICDQFDFLRFAHRTEVDPRPTLGDNSFEVEWKARCTNWSAAPLGALSEGAGIWIRFLDPHHSDEFYSVSQESRRVRRSAVNLEFPDEACRSCHQPLWAYALPKTENYSYRLLGTATILGCLAAEHEPAGLSPTRTELSEEPFEPRSVYILEMTPRTTEAAVRRTVLYVDSEVYVWLAAEFYDTTGLTGESMPLWRMRPSTEGGNLFELAGNFYVSLAKPNSFRSLAPAHGDFKQEINSGNLSANVFDPRMMAR